jgi:hypothetical protein
MPKVKGGEAYDGVDTGHLLEDHEQDGDDGTVSVAWDRPHLPEERLEGGVSRQPSLVIELVGHFLDLVLDVL